MRKEAIKNENYLSLCQLCTIAPGFLLCCVVLRPPTPAAPLRSLPAPGPAWAQTGPDCSSHRASPLPLLPLSVQTQPRLQGSPWADPLSATPFSPALALKHPEVEVKCEEASGRALGRPPEMPRDSNIGRSQLRPAAAAALSHHRPTGP